MQTIHIIGVMVARPNRKIFRRPTYDWRSHKATVPIKEMLYVPSVSLCELPGDEPAKVKKYVIYAWIAKPEKT